jgi:hypothetical protein
MGMVHISYFGVPATTMPNLDKRAKPATTMPHHPKSMSSQVCLRHGFYAVRASPSLSSLIICLRIMNFWGLPVAVIGNSATKLMYRGILK